MSDLNLHTDFESLVAGYLAGNTSPQEVELLENLVKSDPEKRQLFIEIKRSWMLASTAGKSFNQQSAWKKIESQTLKGQNTPKIRPLYPSFSTSGILKMAAVILLLIIGFYSIYFHTFMRQETLQAELKPTAVELQDGSVITVNKGSVIEYPVRFAANERRISLKGEAFFEVTTNPQKEFVVEVQDIEVRVLGTSFNIKSINNESAIEVSVLAGRVAIVAPDIPELILEAGQTGIYHQIRDTLVKQNNIAPNTISWKTRELIFENTSLKEVFTVIANTYGTEIGLREAKLENCTLTATFRDKQLEDVLNIIGETFNLRYVRSNGTLMATGEGCD